MKKILCIAVFLFSSLSFAKNTPAPPPVSSIILMPWDINQNQNLPKEIKKNGFNHITFYINWSDIEKQKGQYEFNHYHKYLDAIVDSGLSLILVLDMGGRPYLDESGKLVEGETTVPKWIYKNYPESAMKNFSGDRQLQLDFTDKSIQKYSSDFLRETVDHFQKKYPGKILGFAIGIQEEHEIKYGQRGYQWRDYKESTQSDFFNKYGKIQPIINYNNNIANGAVKSENLLYSHKEYRENRLRDATCAYAKAIQSKGGAVIGYFAETFTSHDAIYATGIIEKLSDCIDIAVIDFNFFDGYKLVPDSDVLPALANYINALGYKKIMIGAYAEVWERSKKTQDLIPVINRTIAQSLSQTNVIGFEIGGLQRQARINQSATIDLDRLGTITTNPITVRRPTRVNKAKIGILGSATNFYVWHGERSGGRNIHKDALFATYKILSARPELDVHIIGEKNLLQDDSIIKTLDAIFIPHQVAMSKNIKLKLTAFWKNGGALIQDMRLVEFDENGEPTYDWMHDVFGISMFHWKNKGGIFLINNKIYRLKKSPSIYTGYAAITPRQGFKLLANDIFDRENGIMIRGQRTLAFGFIPQLIEDQTKESWQDIFVKEIMNLIPKNSAK